MLAHSGIMFVPIPAVTDAEFATLSAIFADKIESLAAEAEMESLFRILCKYLFSEVAVQAVTELDNKAAHCHTPVPQWHRPFL
ncbi:DUF1382 family protein [Escherichia coli]